MCSYKRPCMLHTVCKCKLFLTLYITFKSHSSWPPINIISYYFVGNFVGQKWKINLCDSIQCKNNETCVDWEHAETDLQLHRQWLIWVRLPDDCRTFCGLPFWWIRLNDLLKLKYLRYTRSLAHIKLLQRGSD